MKYAYTVLPLGPFGGSSQTIWLTSEPSTGLRQAADIYAAHWPETVVQFDVAGSAGYRTAARFKLQRPGFEPLTIWVILS